MNTDKNRGQSSSSTRAQQADSDVEHALGGQPENDQDAREAGLPSATSAAGDEKTSNRKPPQRDQDR